MYLTSRKSLIMQLFKSITPVQSYDPIASLEALQEITDICNSIHNSTPAFEALMELPNLAQEFDTTSTAKLSMLNFVTEQHYSTLGLTNVSVSQEGVVSTVVDAVKKAIEWIGKKLSQLGNWFMSFFSKKPVEQVNKRIDRTIEQMSKHDAFVEQKAKEYINEINKRAAKNKQDLDDAVSRYSNKEPNHSKLRPEEKHRRLEGLNGCKRLTGMIQGELNEIKELSGAVQSSFDNLQRHISGGTMPSELKGRATKVTGDANKLIKCLADWMHLMTKLLHYTDKMVTILSKDGDIDFDGKFRKYFDTLGHTFQVTKALEPQCERVSKLTKANFDNLGNVEYDLHNIDDETMERIGSIHQMAHKDMQELDVLYKEIMG